MPQLIWCSHPLSPEVHLTMQLQMGTWNFWGVNYLAIFHYYTSLGSSGGSLGEMVSPLASYLLVLLQEFTTYMQAAWLCQVSVTAQQQQRKT